MMHSERYEYWDLKPDFNNYEITTNILQPVFQKIENY